jgi:hypothetical protein
MLNNITGKIWERKRVQVGGDANRGLKMNINAQHKIRKRAITKI